jgi:hypothetical protein
VTKEVISQSLDFDHCHVGLGYRLLVKLLQNKNINEKVICLAFEEILSDDLDNLIKVSFYLFGKFIFWKILNG